MTIERETMESFFFFFQLFEPGLTFLLCTVPQKLCSQPECNSSGGQAFEE